MLQEGDKKRLKIIDAQFATSSVFQSLSQKNAPPIEVGSVLVRQKHFVPSKWFGNDSRDSTSTAQQYYSSTIYDQILYCCCCVAAAAVRRKKEIQKAENCKLRVHTVVVLVLQVLLVFWFFVLRRG